MKNFKTNINAISSNAAVAEATTATVGTTATAAPADRSINGLAIAQTVGVFFLYATVAYSAFMQVHAFNTFLVMFNDMMIVGRNVVANQYLASSFALGFGAVPLYVAGLLLRGWTSKTALKWGTVAVFASVLAAIVWLVVIILMSVAVALNPF